ncbi:unnamed protein product [Cutaneotrichosporon oleaginosum]
MPLQDASDTVLALPGRENAAKLPDIPWKERKEPRQAGSGLWPPAPLNNDRLHNCMGDRCSHTSDHLAPHLRRRLEQRLSSLVHCASRLPNLHSATLGSFSRLGPQPAAKLSVLELPARRVEVPLDAAVRIHLGVTPDHAVRPRAARGPILQVIDGRDNAYRVRWAEGDLSQLCIGHSHHVRVAPHEREPAPVHPHHHGVSDQDEAGFGSAAGLSPAVPVQDARAGEVAASILRHALNLPATLHERDPRPEGFAAGPEPHLVRMLNIAAADEPLLVRLADVQRYV